jgi:peptide/nickel transport system permease protein
MRPLARVGLAILGVLLFVAAAAPWIAPDNPNHQVLSENLRGPSPAHPFGQDRAGRDILSRILHPDVMGEPPAEAARVWKS